MADLAGEHSKYRGNAKEFKPITCKSHLTILIQDSRLMNIHYIRAICTCVSSQHNLFNSYYHIGLLKSKLLKQFFVILFCHEISCLFTCKHKFFYETNSENNGYHYFGRFGTALRCFKFRISHKMFYPSNASN